MRSPKSRRWTAVSRCADAPGNRPEEAMTTKGTAPHRVAALDIATGRVIGKARTPPAASPQVLDEIEAAGRENSTSISSWITRHAQDPADPAMAGQKAAWHGTDPTSSSWLNQVERSRAPTDKKIRRGIIAASRPRADIAAFIDRHNAIPNRSDGPNPPMTSAPSSARDTMPRKTATRVRTGG